MAAVVVVVVVVVGCLLVVLVLVLVQGFDSANSTVFASWTPTFMAWLVGQRHIYI